MGCIFIGEYADNVEIDNSAQNKGWVDIIAFARGCFNEDFVVVGDDEGAAVGILNDAVVDSDIAVARGIFKDGSIVGENAVIDDHVIGGDVKQGTRLIIENVLI